MSVAVIAGLIIASIVILAVILLLMRNRGEDYEEDEEYENMQPVQSPNINGGGQMNQLPQNGLGGIQPSAPARNSLAIAQSYIEQQRYDEAEAELKTGIRMQPNNSTLPLKLLNVYALTNNQQGFQSAFAHVMSQGDMVAIQEAERLKAMVQAEQQPMHNQTQNMQASVTQSTSSASMNANAQVNQPTLQSVPAASEPANLDQGLDFDMGGNSNDNSGLSFTDTESSLDTLETSLLDSSNQSASNQMDAGLDFNLDTNDKNVSTNDQSTNDLVFDVSDSQDNQGLSLDEGLSFDTQTNDVETNVNQVTNDLSESQLDMSGLDLGSDISTPSSELNNQTSLNESESLDTEGFDFDAEMNLGDDLVSSDSSAVAATEPTIVEDTAETVDDGFDFDFGDELTDTVEKQDGGSISTGVGAIGAATAVGAAALASQVLTSTDEVSSDALANLDDIDDFSFDSPTLNQPSNSEVEIPNVTSDATDLSTFDSELNGSDLETPVNESPDDVLDSLANFGNDDNMNVSAEATNNTSTLTTSHTANFDVLQTLDSHQITLDLASQYIDLGEYDSAKRLLLEVVSTGSAEQQTQANGLLSHIS